MNTNSETPETAPPMTFATAHLALVLLALPGRAASATPAGPAHPDSTARLEAYHPTQALVGPLRAKLALGVTNDYAVEGPGDSTRSQRPKAIEYSDAYHVRLKIHQIGSYLELPLFAAELIVGQKLANNEKNSVPSSGALRSTHRTLAAGLGILFGVNTVTGLWNLWESRKDPAGRTRRVIHSVGMLLADAGFFATAAIRPERERFEFGTPTGSSNNTNQHRSLAIASVSVATASTLMMWLWKD
jgi:hypothetical protein